MLLHLVAFVRAIGIIIRYDWGDNMDRLKNAKD